MTSIASYEINIVPNEQYALGIQLSSFESKQQNSTVYDPRLGSAVNTDKKCPTCLLDGKTC